MIYRDSEKWALCPQKVTYTKEGINFEEYTNNPTWWQNFAQKWDNIEILEIVDAEYTQDEIDRLNKVKSMSEGHGAAVRQYVETGEFPQGMDMAELLRAGKITNKIIPTEYQETHDS